LYYTVTDKCVVCINIEAKWHKYITVNGPIFARHHVSLQILCLGLFCKKVFFLCNSMTCLQFLFHNNNVITMYYKDCYIIVHFVSFRGDSFQLIKCGRRCTLARNLLHAW